MCVVFYRPHGPRGSEISISIDTYDESLSNMLSDGNYQLVDAAPLMKMINSERKFVGLIKSNLRTKDLARGVYEPATLILAKFYGLPKVHKAQFCLRPITAMNKSPGAFLGKVFNQMLNIIFPPSGHHVKDALTLKEEIKHLRLKQDDVFVSFDVKSMYTNIPTQLAYDIIFSKHLEFFESFGLAKRILSAILWFLLRDCTFFTALNGT